MFAFGSWQGTAGSQRLELTVANVGTTGYHCKELPAQDHMWQMEVDQETVSRGVKRI